MRTDLNVYGLLWGKSNVSGPHSNFRSFFSNLNMIANIVLIVAAIFSYSPKGGAGVSSTGKLLLGVASLNGLIYAFFAFIDGLYLTMSDEINPDEPFKIRRRIATDFKWAVRINSFMSIVVYAAFVYHIFVKDFKLELTFVVPLIDLGICIFSWIFIVCKSKNSNHNAREFTSLFNPLFNYMRFMVWSKMIHSWGVKWIVPLLPIYGFGWLLAVPGFCIATGTIF